MKINTSTSSVRGNTFKLIISLLIPQLAGGLGSYFTIGSVKDWYPVLVKPALNPPAWVFGPIWTTLFALMGIAAFLIWREYDKLTLSEVEGLAIKRKTQIKIALSLFGIQLVLNTLWSIIFFGSTTLTINGLNNIGIALIEIVFLWLAILATIIAFAKISPPSSSIWTAAGHGKLAAWLLVPYILWVSFAMYLNYAIWALN